MAVAGSVAAPNRGVSGAIGAGVRCAEAATPELNASFSAVVPGGRWAETAASEVSTLLFAFVLGGAVSIGGGGLGVATLSGGDIVEGRTSGQVTVFGDVVAGASATLPLGVGPFALGTGASAADPLGFGPFFFGTGVSIAGGR
jgi:hypothetical protein